MTALLALVTLVAIGTPCTNERAAPSLSAPSTACLATGTPVNLTTQIVHADGYDWLQTDSGSWIASAFLQAQESNGTAPPGTSPQTSSAGQQPSGVAGLITPPPAPPSAANAQNLGGSSASGETPAQVRLEIDRQASAAGLNAGCVEALAMRESGDQPSAVNPSGARGLFGWLPNGGEWSSTPLGRAGLPVAQASVSEQVAMAIWALQAGDGGGAWGQSDGCRSPSPFNFDPASNMAR